jgi:hypothetical protein
MIQSAARLPFRSNESTSVEHDWHQNPSHFRRGDSSDIFVLAMMSTSRILCLLALFFLQSISAFTINAGLASIQRSRSVAFSSSMSNGKDTESSAPADTMDPAAVMKYLQSAEIQEVRDALISKYVQLGKSPEDAEREVDGFLSDPERSKQYLEMRRYAKAQADELGFELYLQLGGAMLIGFAATTLNNYYSAYKVRHVLDLPCLTMLNPTSHLVRQSDSLS